MSTREEVSFCRICPASCGLRMTLDENDRIIRIVGDKDQPISKGYACFKGLQAEELHHGSARLLRPLKKLPDGRHIQIDLEDALDEISERMRKILDRDGPEAIAGFCGNGTIYNGITFPLFPQWVRSLGTLNYFTTMTIDSPSKILTPLRLGMWAGGRHMIPESDVLMIVGANPLATHALNHGLISAPTNALKKEKARGLKLIVIDPRSTETARHADVFLQPYPGEDPTLLAGLLNVILTNNWHDLAFCSQHLAPGDLKKFVEAVGHFDLDYVSKRSGVDKEKIVKAARIFASESKSGPVLSQTGPAMSPRGNLSDHLIEGINVVCGRYRRAGDEYTDISPWMPDVPRYAEVIPPNRTWENEPSSRIFGASALAGERMSVTLADEILTPGSGQIKCLINAGGNPALSMPDKKKISRALSSLELLVTVDPFMTVTAKQSDYVLPTKMMFERYDLPLSFMGYPVQVETWAQYAKPVMDPPKDSQVEDDWYIYWGIAKRLGVAFNVNGVDLDMETPTTSEGMIEILTRDSAVPLDEIKKYPSGKIFDIPTHTIQPARPGADGKFDIIPEDVRKELSDVRRERIDHGSYQSNGQQFTHRLTVRRLSNVMNTVVPQLESTKKRYPYNPAWLHPEDLESNHLKSGDEVTITSDHGEIFAIVEPDETLRSGVVSMSHGYGGSEDDEDSARNGSSVNSLISSSRDLDSITAMVRMSSIPVRLKRRGL